MTLPRWCGLRRLPVALAIVALACRGGDMAPPSTSDDTVSGAPLWPIEELARIGSIDDPEQTLVGVGDVRIGPDGLLYVPQSRDGQIRVYGRDGAWLRTIGRKGEGPGELQAIVGMGFLGDTLYVTDWGLGRVSRFASDGTFLSSARWPSTFEPQLSGGLLAIHAPPILLADGSGVVATDVSPPREPNREGVQRRRELRVILRLFPDAPRRDTLAWIEHEWVTHTSEVPGGDSRTMACPFAWQPIAVPMEDGSGAVIVDRPGPSDDRPAFRVTRVDPAGDTLHVERVPYDPIPVDRSVLEELAEGTGGVMDEGEPRPDVAAVESALREMDCLPESMPPVVWVESSQDGTIWIAMNGWWDDEVSTWLVLDGEGRPVGRVEIPAPAVFNTAVDDVLVANEIDELGVTYLTIHHLERR